MVIFHSYVSLPEGMLMVNVAIYIAYMDPMGKGIIVLKYMSQETCVFSQSHHASKYVKMLPCFWEVHSCDRGPENLRFADSEVMMLVSITSAKQKGMGLLRRGFTTGNRMNNAD